jgi:TonB family protein
VSQALQLEEIVEMHDTPKLLVEWSSPWHEFVTSIRPALARSDARLAGEAPVGVSHHRGMILCLAAEAFLIFAVIVVRVKLEQLRPFVAPRLSSHDVIYYSGDELPRTADLGGSQSGTSGRAGGHQAHHRTQTIKIARGGSLTPRVVDAPDLKLPSSHDAVANLLAVKPNPGPPPSEGLRSTRTALSLPSSIVAPAPNVIRDYTRNGVKLDSVIAPSPSLPRDPFRTAPNLSATVIPPSPQVSGDHPLVAPALGPAVIPPAPKISGDRTSAAPSLNTTVVAPAPTVAPDKARPAPALAANVIPPAPGGVSREISSSPVQMANVAVVQPPVSSPERATTRNPKLAMPAPSVIAPPPSADISQDMHRLASGSVPDPSRTVVPPPPTQAGSGSFMSSLIGKIFGATEVVPPPPAVHSSGASGATGAALATNVVPPPPSVANNAAGGNPHGSRNGMGASLGSNVIAPPPSAGASGGTGNRSLSSATAPMLGMPSVVPPPPSLPGAGGGTGDTGGGKGAPGGTLLANNVVPPPPSVAGGANSSGSGLGRNGPGLGGPMDVGSPSVAPTSGGSGTNAGVVMSSEPGSKVGLPTTGGKGSLAMSPSGADKAGLGGAGGGSGIARGEGPGSGMNGEGPGAGKTGPGHGSDPNAHGGISPNPGPGGAGSAPSGNPTVAGVSVEGGSSVVTLPSFGSDPSSSDPSAPGHSSTKQRQAFGVTVVATATSGGAFEPYKSLLRGEKYTTYLDTSLGTVVVEFADAAATGHPTGESIAAPQSFRTDLPAGLPHTRMVVAGTIDASGNLKNVRVLEPGPADMTAKVIAALRGWKFQPAMRSNQPVEVTAILGFNIDTNDRF